MRQHRNPLLTFVTLLLVLAFALTACGPQQPTGGTGAGDVATPPAESPAGTNTEPAAADTEAPTAGETATAPAAEEGETATAPTDEGETPEADTTGTPGTAGAAPGASQCEDTGEEALIFSSLPQTGGSAEQIKGVIEGMQLNLEQRGGKAGGYTINYQPLDDATPAKGSWDEGKETQNANRAVSDQATVYLGTFNSGAAAVAIPILNEAGIPMISPANTAINLTIPGPPDPELYQSLYRNGPRNYFRVVPNDRLQGAALANYAKELGVTKVYVLHDQETYGLGLASVFRDRARELGIEVLGFEGIAAKATSYAGVAQKVVNAGADGLFFGGIDANGGPQLVKDLRALEPDPEAIKFMGGDGIQSSDFEEGAGEEGEGTYATVAVGDPAKYTGNSKKFFDDYQAKYNKVPDPYAIYGYDTMGVALAAIEKACSKDPKAVLDALNNLGEYDGALGRFSLDENGDTTLTKYFGWKLTDGDYVFDREVSTVVEPQE